MLRCDQFDTYEYNANEMSIQELKDIIQKNYSRFHPTLIIDDWDNLETLLGLIAGVMDWRSSSDLEIRFKTVEYVSELLRRKILEALELKN